MVIWSLVLCTVAWYLVASDKIRPRSRYVTLYYLAQPENDNLLLQVYMEKSSKVEELRHKIDIQLSKLRYWDNIRLHSVDKFFFWYANLKCRRIVSKIENLKADCTSYLILQNSLQKIMYEGIPYFHQESADLNLSRRLSRF